jgi:hypothetical protein
VPSRISNPSQAGNFDDFPDRVDFVLQLGDAQTPRKQTFQGATEQWLQPRFIVCGIAHHAAAIGNQALQQPYS